jgi:hypothetical protein
MEPAEAINVVEDVLRQAVRLVLGDRWKEEVDVSKLQERRTEEAKSRNGAVVESDLLAYTHLYEIEKLVTKHWDSFKPIFDDKKRFIVYMDRLKDFRNAPMHSRALLPFERDLLAGIAGELRNSLTLWRSAQAPDMTFYPTIETLTDSFGNDLASAVPNPTLTPNTRLEVGQEVEFRCVGRDPQDRELIWSLNHGAIHGPLLDSATGSEATLTWKVAKAHVGEPSIVVLSMRSDGEYHRLFQQTDAMHSIFYFVDPPQGASA